MTKKKDWFTELIDFYDFIWEYGIEICSHHINEELIKDFAKGGNKFEEMKQKIIEKFPTEKEARELFKKQNG